MVGTPAFQQRGVPFPQRLPVSFRRVPAAPDLEDLVAWWWLCEWDVPAGQHSDQQVLAFPALNFTVDNVSVGVAGATTRSTTRRLSGTGWVVGALLKPAATGIFTRDPASLCDRFVPLELPELHRLVTACPTHGSSGQAIDTVAAWLRSKAPPMTDSARMANQMVDRALSDAEIVSLDDLAEAVGTSKSMLARLAARYIGVSPYTIIRRRRVQEIAERIRQSPGENLAAIAADLGLSDQAHLTREFKAALGITPGTYRAQLMADNSP